MLIFVTVLVLVDGNVPFIVQSVVRFQTSQLFKNKALCTAEADNFDDNRNK